jgi:hypothetical protein
MSSRRSLLDPASGFFVWAIHLLVIYAVASTVCQLGAGHGAMASRSSLTSVLILLTLTAAAVNVSHAILRYRSQRGVEELRFRLMVTIGCDALGSLAILWQLLAVALVPACV